MRLRSPGAVSPAVSWKTASIVAVGRTKDKIGRDQGCLRDTEASWLTDQSARFRSFFFRACTDDVVCVHNAHISRSNKHCELASCSLTGLYRADDVEVFGFEQASIRIASLFTWHSLFGRLFSSAKQSHISGFSAILCIVANRCTTSVCVSSTP